MPANTPNILLILSDQQHYSTVGAVNPTIRTPALDRLGREGARFDRAYCVNPTCTPARASIITGMYPSQHGAWSLGTKLAEDVPVVGDIFRRAGYYTCLIGKAHLQPTASKPGAESIECHPTVRDLDFWRGFHGPWYGFEHVETARMHACEHLVGGHYALWMEEQGLHNWPDYFDSYPPDQQAAMRRREDRHWDLPQEFHYTRWTGLRTIAQIEHAAEGHRPFFISANFHDPHPPYLAPEPWASMYNPADMAPGRLTPGEHDSNPVHFGKTQEDDPDFWQRANQGQAIHGGGCQLRDPAELRKDMACYYGMVSFMDQQIGLILDALDRLKLTDNTLVVFTTDHGHFLGQHGLTAKGIHHYEDMLRIPFIVRWPGRTPANRRSNALQNQVDLPVSFLAAAGLEAPCHMTGLNQLPTWSGGPAVRAWSITENHQGVACFHLRTYVNDRYKLTVYCDGADGELFDLETDPGELRNLWHDPAARPLKADLLYELIQATLQSESTHMPRIAPA